MPTTRTHTTDRLLYAVSKVGGKMKLLLVSVKSERV